ncbi:MAG: anti-sigma-I factor RsgI family protein [Erysipelotrichaceae bacterium]
MNKLEKSIQKNAFNQDEMFHRIQAESYGMKSNTLFGGTPMKKVIGLIALSFTLIFAVWFGFNQNDIARNEEVVMLVGVDINPSFELSVNRNNNVVKIEALNDDAKTIDVSDLIDEPVEDVVEEIIRRATEAGFIDLIDLDEDFVVVSTVSLEDDEDDQDEFEEEMEKKIRDSEFLQSLNIVQIKATQREKFEAEGKNIPVGLYVINGYVLQEDGTFLSAKEFFSDPENKEKISNRSNITLEKQEKLKLRLEETLSKLELNGFDATQYRLRLEVATFEQMLEIQAELKVETKNMNKESNKSAEDDEESEITEPRGNSNVLPKENQNAGKGN